MWREQRVCLAERVAAIAAPAIVRGLVYHARAHGIELDIALAGQQVFVGLNQRGLVAAVPQRTCAAISLVDVLHVTFAQRHDETAHGFCRRRWQQQMNMIGHQDPFNF